MANLDGACAVVTGAGSGIGRACALRLARDGARLALLDRNADAAQQTQHDIESLGAKATAFPADVTDAQAVSAAVDAATGTFGPPRILINSAGIAVRKGLLDTSLEEWQQVIGVNLTGYFIVLRKVAAAMAAADGGSIVQIASIAGHIGYGYPSYTAAKGGVLAMTRQLAAELARHRIRINSISPGVVQTGLNRDTLADDTVRTSTVGNIPVGRLGRPEDIAEAAAFLAGPAAAFVTGSDLVVDGGMISCIHWGQAADKLTHFHENR
jgi:NAD(P)-dependent dehydrogenase (short-subunit alcohol dehydrogenase family)